MILDEEFDFYFDGQPQGKATVIFAATIQVLLSLFALLQNDLKMIEDNKDWNSINTFYSRMKLATKRCLHQVTKELPPS